MGLDFARCSYASPKRKSKKSHILTSRSKAILKALGYKLKRSAHIEK